MQSHSTKWFPNPVPITIPTAQAPFHRRVLISGLKRLKQPAGDFGCRLARKLSRTWNARERVAKTYFGATMQVELSDILGAYVHYFGVWEPHISAFVESRLEPGDVFCDAGANFGYYSLLGSHAVGPSGRVIAIEPSPPTLAVLRRNIALSEASNIRAVEAAVSDHPSTATLYSGPGWNPVGEATLVPSRSYGEIATVSVLPLGQILSTDERRALRLIKIDVEGAEGLILGNLIETIGDYAPDLEVIVELADAKLLPGTRPPTEIVRRFAAIGFRAYELPNVYDARHYLDFKAAAAPMPFDPTQSAAVLAYGEHDILFSRQADI